MVVVRSTPNVGYSDRPLLPSIEAEENGLAKFRFNLTTIELPTLVGRRPFHPQANALHPDEDNFDYG